MVNRIEFQRIAQGGATITVDGERLRAAPSQAIRNHSPDGFEFGYGGSGPAQSALAILLHILGKRNADEHWKGGDAERLYQRFKAEHVASLPHSIPSALIELDVEEWADAQLATV